MLPSRLSGLNSTGVGGFGGGTGGEWGERTPVAQPNVMAPRQAQPTVAQPTVAQPSGAQPTVSGETAGQLAQIMGGLNKPAASETPLSVLSVGQDPYEAQYNQYANIYKEQADQEIDPNRLYQDKLKQYQSQIDAVNEIYRQRLNSERLEAQGRMGSTAAMAGRSGVLGSDFGASQLDKTTGYNADIRAATQAEQAALIGQIMGQVRKDAADELAAKTQAKMNGAEAYMEFLQGASERRSGKAQNIARMLLEQGLEPDQVDWDQTLKGSNLKSDEVISAYQSAKTEQEAAQSEADRKQLVEDRKFELEQRKADIDEAYKEGTLTQKQYEAELADARGWYNAKTNRMNASGGGLSIGEGQLNQEAIADVHQNLQESRGQDGYADTQVYMNELEGFVSLDGDPKEFIKEYDPNIYINPNDPTRSFLESQMKKSSSDNLFLGNLDIASAIAEASAGE